MAIPDKIRRQIYRQASAAIVRLLNADLSKRKGSSVEALTLAPAVLAKKATHALTCQTLRYLPVLKELLQGFEFSFAKRAKVREELLYVLVYDLLFGEGLLPCGDAEKAVVARKAALQARLARLMLKRQVSSHEELLPPASRSAGPPPPRYVRVNTLKLSIEEAAGELRALRPPVKVERDNLIPELLVLPPGTELHAHPRVKAGALFLQGKASCLPARALAPLPTWEVLDACAAPGNKTTHLAALMEGKGRIVACEMDAGRVQHLRRTVALAGATNVEVLHADFLKLDPFQPELCNVKALLLDPSCSGSGTRGRRMDDIMPSAQEGESKQVDVSRIEQLAAFQRAALLHALSFPCLERLVYSTCSVHEQENEGVVQAVLPAARLRGFQLATALPEWPHRGLPTFDGAHHVLRTNPERDEMDGFFVALFVRDGGAPTLLGELGSSSKATTRGLAPPLQSRSRGVGGSGRKRAQTTLLEERALHDLGNVAESNSVSKHQRSETCGMVRGMPSTAASSHAQATPTKGRMLSQLRRRRSRSQRRKKVT